MLKKLEEMDEDNSYEEVHLKGNMDSFQKSREVIIDQMLASLWHKGMCHPESHNALEHLKVAWSGDDGG